MSFTDAGSVRGIEESVGSDAVFVLWSLWGGRLRCSVQRQVPERYQGGHTGRLRCFLVERCAKDPQM